MFGLAVEHAISHDVDLCSRFVGSNKLAQEICVNISFFLIYYYWDYCTYWFYCAGKWSACDIGLNGIATLDPVMIRPPGLDNGAFVLSPDSVWYAQVLLLFSATAQNDTGSKTFECALVSTLETYDDPEHDYYCHYCHY